MQITAHDQEPTPLRSVNVTVDFEGGPDEMLHIHVNGADTGVRIRLDGTADGVMFEVGEKIYRHPVGGNEDGETNKTT